MDSKNFQLASFSTSELIEMLRPLLYEVLKELSINYFKDYPQEEVFNFEDLCAFLKRTPPNTREAIIGYGIPPHEFKPNAHPHYLKQEVINSIRYAPTSQWFNQRRELFLRNIKE